MMVMIGHCHYSMIATVIGDERVYAPIDFLAICCTYAKKRGEGLYVCKTYINKMMMLIYQRGDYLVIQ